MPFIGKLPDVGAFRLIDSITTSATDTYALQVEGLSYFPSSARNLIVSLNGVTQAPESAYTVSGSNIVFASALTASDVIDYILVIGESVDIGTPSDNTVGNAQLKSDLDFSGKTLTFSADQISGDAINGGTISSFASTGIDDNATSTALTVTDSGIAATLTTAAQPNITSVGTLTGFTSTGIDDNASSTAITIDSSQNVAIGSAVTPAYGKVRIESGLELHASQQLNIVTGNTNPFELVNRSAGGFDFYPTGTVRAMRLDASGNVLVGTTSFSTTTRGIKLDADGDIAANQDGQAVAFFGRLTSDGDIAVFRKDGTTKGTIGVAGNDIYHGSGDTGLKYYAQGDAIHAYNTSTLANRDAAIDLGLAGIRFKDLYLSGGINFSANSNASGMTSELLDDYEEGTWTPALSTGTHTYTVQSGKYTKIGNLVLVTATITISSRGSAAGEFGVNGLPFNRTLGIPYASTFGLHSDYAEAPLLPTSVSPTGCSIEGTIAYFRSPHTTYAAYFINNLNSSGNFTFALAYLL